MNLTDYRTLGRSGLAVSPLALGAMTFGAAGWGADEDESRAVFEAYLGEGGNMVDTAEVYSGGVSERYLGRMVANANVREQVIISTKFGWPRASGPLPSGGSSAKTIRSAIEGSLGRLGTEYIDLYWMHVWDRTTPAEEVVTALTDAVSAGKILYYGLSNAPGWFVAQVATLARAHGLPAPIGLQYGYSLVDRGVELDIIPAGQALGLGLVAWGPLTGGFLTGKYGRDKLADADRPSGLPAQGPDTANESRNRLDGDNPMGGAMFTEHNFGILDALRDIAEQMDRPMAQVALAWVTQRSGVTSVLTGTRRVEQLHENIAALDIEFSEESWSRLDEVSGLPALPPYSIFALPVEASVGANVMSWHGR